MSSVYQHATLGTLEYKNNGSVSQFLGIKYASLKDRLSPPILLEYDAKNKMNATCCGPSVLSNPGGCDVEFGLIQQTLPKPQLTMSDLDCLNLNISVPASTLNTASPAKVPVFVYVHGGGFGLGSNAWPQYDLAALVSRSVEIGVPVIGVGINYRLSLPGFLTSQELKDAGYKSNNGLRDQAAALRWVQKHIPGFHGDSDNVTFAGESAGAISGHYLLQSETPLFQRYASLSGSAILMHALPAPVCEHAYATACDALRLQHMLPEERIRALVTMSAYKLMSMIGPQIPLLPALDGEFVQTQMSFDHPLPSSGSWCKELFIGDCGFDASIFAGMFTSRMAGIGKAFLTVAEKVIISQGHSKEAAQVLLLAYKLDGSLVSNRSDEENLRKILLFAHDICWLTPCNAIARRWAANGKAAYVYRFNETNPWDGPWKGYSTHILDVAYIFLNFLHALNEPQKKVALAFADDFLNFVSGKQPWKAIGMDTEHEGVQVYGPSDADLEVTFVKGLVGGKTGRGARLYNVVEKSGIPLEDLASVWNTFMRG